MRWLRKLWGREAPPPTPVLLRVTDAEGETPPVLDIEAHWLPSGRRVGRSVRTAEGLCVVHWRGEEQSVELVLRSVSGEARVSVDRDREDRGRVREVRLAVVSPSEATPPAPSVEPGAIEAARDGELTASLSVSGA